MDQSNPPDRAEPLTNARPEPPAEATAPPPPVSARAWLSQNGPWLIFFALGIAWVYQRFGPEWLVYGAVMLLGLGFVIFIHELGHFLAAKWCDVHVLTFSIGFGPAVPGCSFTRGETTYKLALLPLGGYVNMVGEGPEADEDEDYPRSFKNKTVGQRMLIISAGVIMNVIFGALCFVLVYLYVGVERPPAIVWRTESGSRAWEAGVRPGWKLVQLDDKKEPWFDEMRVAVALSPEGKKLEFTFRDRTGNLHTREIEPLRDKNNVVPVIGVSQASVARLIPERYVRLADTPYRASSAAAAARAIDLGKNEVVLAATDPAKDNALVPLPNGPNGWLELCRRMQQATDRPLTLEVSAENGKTRKIETPVAGFLFGDVILGTTDPATPDQPFNLLPLPSDPNADPQRPAHDPFVLRNRMAALAGKPMVFQVSRSEGTDTASILVPPAYHLTLGMRMNMGKVAALREGSPAIEAGLKAGAADGDVITGVRLEAKGKPSIILDGNAMDPVRLPFELDRRMRELGAKAKAYRVVLTVRGPVNHDARKERTLPPLVWDDSYSLADEAPVSPAAPLSIPQLGIAYWVDSTVLKVEPGSPAEKAGLQVGDIVQKFRCRMRGRKPGQTTWSKKFDMYSVRGSQKEVYDQWAHYHWFLQQADHPEVRLWVKRTGEDGLLELPQAVPDEEGIKAVPDTSWPLIERGLLYDVDERRHKAKSFVEALSFGMDKTVSFIHQIYMNLSRLITGRISTKSLGGPIEIGAQAMGAAMEGPSFFALFLGMISINLAVVNFLPIPVLDGGHMVFLIYEKLRGRPPSEAVRIAATYLGLAIILSLMIFVFVLDIRRRFL